MTWVRTKGGQRGLTWCAALLAVALVWLVSPVQSADSPVAAAAKAGDLTATRALIQQRADVNMPESDGSTALLWATYHSDAEMVRVLLAAGARVDVANRYGVTPLLQASRVGDPSTMDLLLKAGADPTLRHAEGETPLMAAARTGHVEAVQLLLARKVDVNAVDGFQRETALMWAAADGHVDMINALLAAGALPNLKAGITSMTQRSHADHPTGGFTALMFAARNGHEGAVRALMGHAATNPNLTNGDGVTAMNIAIVNDRFDLAAKMLEWGADPNDNSLYFAVDMHDATTDARARDGSQLRANHPNQLTSIDLVRMYLDRGADPNKLFVGTLHSVSMGTGDNHNGTPFSRAATASDVEAMRLMLAKGADVNWVAPAAEAGGGGGGGRGAGANAGRTPIMVTMGGGRGMAFGAGPGFGREGPPPFREASNRTPLDAVKLLIEAGANLNAQAGDGTALIHQAANGGNLDVIRALASAGAQLDIQNKDGLTALDVAEGRQAANAPARAGGAGAAAGGGAAAAGGRAGGAANRTEVAKLLRELMGLPPADPSAAPAEAAAPQGDAQ